jgi:hypothetical protein
MREKIDAGTYTFSLGKGGTKYVLMGFPQTIKWRMAIVNRQWQNIDEVVACKEVLSGINKRYGYGFR